MNLKWKVITLVLVTVAVAGALFYVPMIGALQPDQNQVLESERGGDGKLIWWLLNNSKPAEVRGAIATLHRGMLIVNTADGQARIFLPEEWTVDTDVVMRETLFRSDSFSAGEDVIVSALKIDIVDKEGLCIYFLVGYEITNESGVRAYATLPLNIET
jgi:hypothetical protein